MARATITGLLPQAAFYIASRPAMSSAEMAGAAHLRAVIEVAGAFRDRLEYEG